MVPGHRGEQKWRLRNGEKKKKKGIDSQEDIHLQDLEYSGKKNEGEEMRKEYQQEENLDKESYRKKHNKVNKTGKVLKQDHFLACTL